MTSYQHAIVDGSKIFYREAGSENRPNHTPVARLSNVVAHVPQPHSGPGRPLPCGRA